MDVHAIPSAGRDERDARLGGTGAMPIRDGHQWPVIRTDCLGGGPGGSPGVIREPYPHPSGTDAVPLALPRSPTRRKTCCVLYSHRRLLDASELFSEIPKRVNSLLSQHSIHLGFTV